MQEGKLVWGVKQEHLDMPDNILLTARKFRNQVHLLCLLIKFKYFLSRQMSCSFLSFSVGLFDEKFWHGGLTEVATFEHDLGWSFKKSLVVIGVVNFCEKLMSDGRSQVFNKLGVEERSFIRCIWDIRVIENFQVCDLQ